MLVELSSILPAPSGEEDAVPDGLAARVASGPGFWTDWLAEPDRQGLLEDLLADGVIARALREAPTGHRYDRVLTAKMTAICVLVACLFPGDGYDAVLAKAFRLPGLRFSPGTGVPAGSALSQARRLLGEQAMRRIFELDAERSDADLGITALWKGLEVTAIDGTTMELARNDALACEFGTPADGARPLLRIVAHVRTASRRWISAEIGGYHDGENDLADKLEWSFRPGMLNLADRGFFSMDRFLRFSATGSDLAWRVKNGAKCVPFKTVRELPDGSELVMLHESDGMRTRRRRDTGNPHAERLPDTTARLVTFTILTATRSGRAKTTQMRVLTTLLDHEAFPAREIAALYAERWQVETAFLHLKKTVRGPRRALRGQSPDLARQEAWALHQALAREGFWFLGTFRHPGIPIPWCHRGAIARVPRWRSCRYRCTSRHSLRTAPTSAASGKRLPKAALTASRCPAFPPNCNFCCTTAIRSGRPTNHDLALLRAYLDLRDGMTTA